MVKREVFLEKPRHQYHLSQRGEWTCSAQSLKEKRLLCESKFVQIERWTLVLKMVEREVLLRNQSINIINPSKENMFMMPNNEMKGDY